MKFRYRNTPPDRHYGGESIFVAIITCALVSLMGISLAKLHNASFQGLFSSEATMQAQHYAKTKMDYLVFNGYNSLAAQSKTAIENTEFQDTVILGNTSTDVNGISHRLVTVSVYKGGETVPRASLNQVFYSNDANKYVTNGSSATSSISMHYDKDNDRLYAMVDGQERTLGGGVPIGTVIAWASNSNPAEGTWLDCNGQSCATYPELVAVLGKNTVPDYRGRFLEGNTVAGMVKEAGLPNIEGKITNDPGDPSDYHTEVFDNAESGTFTGPFIKGPWVSYEVGLPLLSYVNSAPEYIGFDASRCSSIYGASDTVQPPSVTVRYLIRAA